VTNRESANPKCLGNGGLHPRLERMRAEKTRIGQNNGDPAWIL